jgi:hypothetical protein
MPKACCTCHVCLDSICHVTSCTIFAFAHRSLCLPSLLPLPTSRTSGGFAASERDLVPSSGTERTYRHQNFCFYRFQVDHFWACKLYSIHVYFLLRPLTVLVYLRNIIFIELSILIFVSYFLYYTFPGNRLPITITHSTNFLSWASSASIILCTWSPRVRQLVAELKWKSLWELQQSACWKIIGPIY